MKYKKISILIILVLTLNFFSIGFFSFAITTNSTELPKYDRIDIGPELRADELPINGKRLSISAPKTASYPKAAYADGYYEVGDITWWLALDNYMGWYFWTLYELKAIEPLTEIWVQLDLSYPEGDPRPTHVIEEEHINYLLNEFETIIYPIDTGYFGISDEHDGDESFWPEDYMGSDRNVILVSNIRDERYYHPEYPYYIAGFYSPTYEYNIDRNIITIDSRDWENRIGPGVERPYLYESVIAHEYQHLIHDDWNPDDETFMNEGCSMYAEYLCGYGIAWGDINSYLATPDNSLTEWGDQGSINILADYGAALLWGHYLNDRFGDDFLGNFVQAGLPGIPGIEAAFTPLTFDQVFLDWRIANLIHSDDPGGGIYNYDTIDLGSREADSIQIYEVKEKWPSEITGSSFGPTITILDYNTYLAFVNSYGSDYLLLSKLQWQYFSELVFDGDDLSTPLTWVREGDGFYSTETFGLSDYLIMTEIDLSGPSILTFDTYYDIEESWDFGFVQISTDGGATWTSLSNEYTTNEYHPDAHPNIKAYLIDGEGLTGWSGGWITMSFDLPDYANPTPVLIGFRYMTDWATELPGWWIENIAINGNPIDPDDFFSPTGPETDFMVTIIRVDYWQGDPYYSLIYDMNLLDATEIGSVELIDYTMWGTFPYNNKKPDVYLIVSPKVGPADYEFSVNPLAVQIMDVM